MLYDCLVENSSFTGNLFLDIDDDEVQSLLTKLKSRIDQWGGAGEGVRIKLVAVVCFMNLSIFLFLDIHFLG